MIDVDLQAIQNYVNFKFEHGRLDGKGGLGHSSASTTLNYYAHADKMSKIEIANSYNKREITNNSHSKVTVNKVKCKKNTGKQHRKTIGF